MSDTYGFAQMVIEVTTDNDEFRDKIDLFADCISKYAESATFEFPGIMTLHIRYNASKTYRDIAKTIVGVPFNISFKQIQYALGSLEIVSTTEMIAISNVRLVEPDRLYDFFYDISKDTVEINPRQCGLDMGRFYVGQDSTNELSSDTVSSYGMYKRGWSRPSC